VRYYHHLQKDDPLARAAEIQFVRSSYMMSVIESVSPAATLLPSGLDVAAGTYATEILSTL